MTRAYREPNPLSRVPAFPAVQPSRVRFSTTLRTKPTVQRAPDSQYWSNVANRHDRLPVARKDGTTIVDWFPSVMRWVAIPNGKVEKRVKSPGQVFCTCGHGFIWWEGGELPCKECLAIYREQYKARHPTIWSPGLESVSVSQVPMQRFLTDPPPA